MNIRWQATIEGNPTLDELTSLLEYSNIPGDAYLSLVDDEFTFIWERKL